MAVSSQGVPESVLEISHRKDNNMPYVNIKITREGGTTEEQKSALIKGVTAVLVKVLDKSPTTTFVVIDEVEMENWGIGGLPVEAFRRASQSQHSKTA
jgi:4-oxalocrotonate tautomerase